MVVPWEYSSKKCHRSSPPLEMCPVEPGLTQDGQQEPYQGLRAWEDWTPPPSVTAISSAERKPGMLLEIPEQKKNVLAICSPFGLHLKYYHRHHIS